VAPPPDTPVSETPASERAPALEAERWRRLEEIFLDAVDLPDTERRAFVAWSCGDDDELRRGVDELLVADPGSDDKHDSDDWQVQAAKEQVLLDRLSGG